MNKQFYTWLAGFIDGDECFCMYPKCREPRKYLTIGFSVSIGLAKESRFVLEYIQQQTELGKVYSRGTEADCWQTVSVQSAIKITERVLPYLILKRDVAEKFLKAAKQYYVKPVRGKRPRGTRLRSNKEMKDYIDIALSLNKNNQTDTFRKAHGRDQDYWYTVVDKLYSQEVN